MMYASNPWCLPLLKCQINGVLGKYINKLRWLLNWLKKWCSKYSFTERPNKLSNCIYCAAVKPLCKQCCSKRWLRASSPGKPTNLIILEDAGNYVASNMRLNLIELCTSCRHSNVDLFFMFHNLADIPPKLYAYCDYIVLFKIKKAESQLKLLDKITNKEETLEAFRSLKKDKEPHANRTVRIQAS